MSSLLTTAQTSPAGTTSLPKNQKPETRNQKESGYFLDSDLCVLFKAQTTSFFSFFWFLASGFDWMEAR